MRYISIDPGKKGAAVLMDGRNVVGIYLFKGIEEGINVVEWYDQLLKWEDLKPIERCFIERIAPVPMQSIYSSSEQFYTLGQTKCCISLLQITIEEIYPLTWMSFAKKLLGGRAKDMDGKRVAQILARKYFPHEAEKYTPRTKVHDGVADALGLMLYVQRDYYGSFLDGDDLL